MIRKLFTTVLIVFCFAIFSFAQDMAVNDDRKIQQTSDRQKKKRTESVNELVDAAKFLDLNFFLPESENAWALSLTSTGGFFGGTRLLAAVNSNGNYLCDASQEFKNRLLEKDVLDRVFNFVETFDFSKFSNEDAKLIEGCMDCAYTTLTLQTKTGIFRQTRNSFYNATGDVKEIYDRLSALEECK